MKRWIKRLLRLVACLLLAAVIVSATGFALMRGTPEWYKVSTLTREQLDAAAQRAENMLLSVQNWASDLRGRETAARMNPSTTAVPSPRPMTMTFTQDEINALLEKWSVWHGWKDSYEKYLTDPQIVLRDGRIMLAGKVRELNTIASLHFEPKLDEQGKLRLNLVRILAGKLPMPEGLVGRYKNKLSQSLVTRLPGWQRYAKIGPTGLANDDAVDAAMVKLMLSALNHEPGEAVLFVRGVPVQIDAVQVTSDRQEPGRSAVSLTVRPLTPDARKQLLDHIREPYGGMTASSE